jgi:hypothetical protein
MQIAGNNDDILSIYYSLIMAVVSEVRIAKGTSNNPCSGCKTKGL